LTENLIAKWALIITLIGLSCWMLAVGNINPGIDLRGGRSITYEFRKESFETIAPGEREKAINETIDTISKRIDKLGVRELTTRKLGDNQFVLEAPKMTDAELIAIKNQLLALGNLEFLIGLRDWPAGSPLDIPSDKADEFQRYTFDKNAADAQRKEAYESGKTKLGKDYRDGEPYVLLDTTRTPPVELPIVWMAQHFEDDNPAVAENLRELEKSRSGKPGVDHSKIEGSWLYRDPHFFGKGKEGFTGLHIKDVRRAPDRLGQRAVSFDIERLRQDDFAEYTGKYVNKLIALCLNDEVWSQATIKQELRESVLISNDRGFSQEEQTFLVNCLTSGSLRLKPRQSSEEEIGPALGALAIKRGTIASVLSGVIVLLAMIWYYRFAGVVADFALLLNLFFIVTVLVLFEATLSLPAIAGIVLSVGMGVDANVLVFERTREELQKGKSALQALQGGYQGAFSAIFDGNVTSAITAALMIYFGTGPIRGFGTTLLAGLIIQMFTALFVTKAVFGLCLKKGWLTKFNFIDVFKVGNYAWTAKARPWQIASLLMTLMTVILFVATGDSKYGLDFTGGTSARMKLAAPVTTAEVQSKIDAIQDVDGSRKYAERDVILRTNVPGAEGNRSTEFDVKLRSEVQFTDAHVKEFVQGHMKRLFPNDLDGDGVPSLSVTRPGEWKVEVAFKEPKPAGPTRLAIDTYTDEYQNRPFAGSVIEAVDLEMVPDPNEIEAPVPKARRFTIEVARQDVAAGSAVADLRRAFADKLRTEEPFSHVSYLGPNVVASLKESAIVSMIFAIGAIILYVWLRFKEVKYGVAGVLALAHDVVVPLGLGILVHKLGILNVPITLQSIAAFLTILGYGINDTIVIFDRVRENLGHIKGSFREVMDISLSQTFSRTILTTSAVVAVLLVLFVANIGQDSPLEGMAFLLLMGTLCSSYSTIFIACPFAVWITERRERLQKMKGKPPVQQPVAATV
jgi:SecD/SecF fusion protein